ncbi:MAG: TonB-dependent receptor [Alistipes sp.]
MNRAIVILFCALLAVLQASAQSPLYIVNGQLRDEISTIPPEQIERAELLPADEQTIARYGVGASNGVMLITLRYDQAAQFAGGQSFTDYIAARVPWSEKEAAARVVLRYTIAPDGKAHLDAVLESTSARLLRRLLKTMDEAPLWAPATQRGKPVASQGVLRIELPKGKTLPREPELILR